MSGLPEKKDEVAPKTRWMDRHLEDVRQILAIHRFRRPDLSVSEKAFIERFILPLNVIADSYGNYYKQIGDAPRFLWSCHLDTVHRDPGIQDVAVFGPKGSSFCKTMKLATSEKISNCLGADDGAGIWILLQMIERKVPGLYVFHRNEEHGCKGSRYVLQHHAEVLNGIDAAIAFDRRGKRDIITHQCSIRTCSDVFARSLATGLGMNHRPDDGGVYTDTEVYKSVIPECTNVAAGYEGAHGSGESLDLEYLIQLRDAMLRLDLNSLKIERDPSVVERKSYYTRWSRNDGWESDYNKGNFKGNTSTPALIDKEPATLLEFIKKCPDEVADLLEQWGLDLKGMKDYVEQSKKALPAATDTSNIA